MLQLQVLIPGPWWHELTYQTNCDVPLGARVLVPMGQGVRVGLAAGSTRFTAPIPLKNVLRVLDAQPVLNRPYLQAVHEIARAFLCSPSEILRLLMPASFWRGEPFAPYGESGKFPFSFESCYRYDDEERWRFYREKIFACRCGALVLFSEREQAQRFFKSLAGAIPKDRLILWPASGAQAATKSWRLALSRGDIVIVGGPGAAAAPLAAPELFIIDGEANPSWRSKKRPPFSLRSFAAARARASGGCLVMGGRLPSSRVFKNFYPVEWKTSARAVVRILNVHGASLLPFRGVKFPLPFSDVFVAETLRHVADKHVVFWLLDRRGVSGELQCADCGQTVQCPRCGGVMAFERDEMRCPLCGAKTSVPEVCPQCGGLMLQGTSPGLEALQPMAQNLLGSSPVCLWHAGNPANLTDGRRRLAELKQKGGLLLGSRRALSLLDELSPALIGWLDADAEARQPDYTSRFSAFSMFEESLWRGQGTRTVLFQTRRPGQLVLRSLQAGWNYFWREELAERSAFSFPPYSHMVRLELPKGWKEKDDFVFGLDEVGFTTMQSDAAGAALTVFTARMAPLRRYLEKYFTIQNSRRGFPSVEVCSD